MSKCKHENVEMTKEKCNQYVYYFNGGKLIEKMISDEYFSTQIFVYCPDCGFAKMYIDYILPKWLEEIYDQIED
jgi:hypothetical protein